MNDTIKMKQILALALMAIAVSACERADRNSAEAYRRTSDQWISRLALPNVGIWPCKENEPTNDCFKMQPSQRWRGIWALGPEEETERFCPNSAAACDWERRPRYTLEWNRQLFTNRPQVKADWGKRFALEFVGRRTTYKSGYWGEDYTIVVDRMISMKEIKK